MNVYLELLLESCDASYIFFNTEKHDSPVKHFWLTVDQVY